MKALQAACFIRKYLKMLVILFTLITLCSLVYRCIDTICLTETQFQIPSLAGYKFEVLETNCDTIGNETTTTVYATNNRTEKRYAVIKYGPEPDVLPKIEQIGDKEILISIAEIADLYFEKNTIDEMQISYDIPRIEYQDPQK